LHTIPNLLILTMTLKCCTIGLFPRNWWMFHTTLSEWWDL